MKKKIALLLCLSGTASAQITSKVDSGSYNETMNQLQSKSLVKQVEIINHAPAPPCAVEKTPEKKQSEQAMAYACAVEELNAAGEVVAPKKVKSKTPEKPYQVTYFLDNDNVMMGAVKSGNDIGLTHRMGLAYLQQLPNDQTVSFDVTNELYSKVAKRDFAIPSAQSFAPSFPVSSLVVKKSDPGLVPINFIDVTRFKAAYRKGKDFYFKAAIGLELRKTEAKGMATDTQNWWHKTIGAQRYKYVPADGAEEKIVNDGGKVEITTGYKADERLAATSRTSVITEGAVGKNIRFFQGHCTLQVESGFSISTEGNKAVGPNSFVNANSNVSADLFKKIDGKPRLSASAGGAIFYFPAPNASDVRKIGTTGELTLTSSHYVGKNKNVLQPFFTFWIPGGRQQFENMNDRDMIQRIGVRYIFGN